MSERRRVGVLSGKQWHYREFDNETAAGSYVDALTHDGFTVFDIKKLEEPVMHVDINKQYRTRDGKKVRLISDAGHADRPIVGFVEGSDCPSCWTRDGFRYATCQPGSDNDLVEVPQKHVRWMRVYEAVPGGDFQSKICPTEEDARSFKANCLIAIVRIEFEEGEGLEQEDRHEYRCEN